MDVAGSPFVCKGCACFFFFVVVVFFVATFYNDYFMTMCMGYKGYKLNVHRSCPYRHCINGCRNRNALPFGPIPCYSHTHTHSLVHTIVQCIVCALCADVAIATIIIIVVVVVIVMVYSINGRLLNIVDVGGNCCGVCIGMVATIEYASTSSYIALHLLFVARHNNGHQWSAMVVERQTATQIFLIVKAMAFRKKSARPGIFFSLLFNIQHTLLHNLCGAACNAGY